MDRGAWGAIVHGITKESDTTEQLALSVFHFPFLLIVRIEPASPALASAVFTTEPPGKPIGGYSLLLTGIV